MIADKKSFVKNKIWAGHCTTLEPVLWRFLIIIRYL